MPGKQLTQDPCGCQKPPEELYGWCVDCEQWSGRDDDDPDLCFYCGTILDEVYARPGCMKHAHLLDRWCDRCGEWLGRKTWPQGGPFPCPDCGGETTQGKATS